MRLPIEVVCALIIDRNMVLIVQHGKGSKHPGKWEFPGGKIHEGESSGEALIREIREELGTALKILFPLQPVDFMYPGKQVHLIPFICQLADNQLVLYEHQDFRWVKVEELFHYDLLPADRKMLETGDNFHCLKDWLSGNNQRLTEAQLP